MNARPLLGLRVLNTRPKEQAKTLSDAITAAGGISINCPALALEPTNLNWVDFLPQLNKVNYAIFTSKNAVEYCLKALKKYFMQWPETIYTFAIGHSTAKYLEQSGLNIHGIAPESTSESLLKLKAFQNAAKKTILLVTGENGRTLIAETLQTREALLYVAEVYRRIPPKIPKSPELLWHQSSIDIILWTSQEAMQNIINLFKVPEWFFDIPCLVISSRLKNAATSLGFKTIIVSKPDGVLNTLCQFNKGFIHDKTYQNPS